MPLKMPPKLFDVIDQEDAERLIAQHDRFAFRGLFISKRDEDQKWYIYNKNVEVHFKHDNTAKPIGYDTLAEALFECNDANLEMWGLI